MKNVISWSLLFFSTLTGAAQISNPVQWNFSAKKISDKTYELHLTPTIKNFWHIYSQTSPEEGAVPTKITFKKNPVVSFEGPVREIGKTTEKYEDVLGITVKFLEGNTDFVQKIELKAKVKTMINGSVEFMVCNDNQCLPPEEIEFTIKLE